MTARILVIDDIEANVRLLEAKLSAEYYDVLTAFDGPTGLAMAAAEHPDIVLLDVMMPGMDGFEVCRRLKDDPLTRHIPVVLVTALDGRGDRIAGEIVSKFVKSSSSPQLTKLALEKLNNAHFSKSTGPEPQQFGDVTIFFTTRK